VHKNNNVARLLLYLPCCIGDVVLATAALAALRRAYPAAHIAWAVGGWSKEAVEAHPLLDTTLDTGASALPVKSVRGFAQTVRLLRDGRYDLLVSLVRSPLMSAAALLSGIPSCAGIDSGGRGFGYTHRAHIDPAQPRHEAEVYLDVVRALGIDTADCYANIPVQDAARGIAQRHGVTGRYLVVNPAGGRNPGMIMESKRYPPAQMAALAERLATRLDAQVVILAGRDDGEVVAALRAHLRLTATALVGVLSFGEMAGLAAESALYLGNDTGLTHYAAAAGAKTVMILGPSDLARYAPFTRDSLALWKPTTVSAIGVAGAAPRAFDWARDGIGVDEAEGRIVEWMRSI
jgi:ADP-heptose:LPS heptosyltransferase